MAGKNSLPKLKPIAAAVAAALGGTAAYAQSETPLPEVTVTTPAEPSGYRSEQLESPKYTEPLRDTPQSVTVVPERIIEERGATTLRDVLRNVTGISIQAGEGNPPSGDQLKLRGFSVRDDLLVDNVRDVGSFTRDPFNVERIEVFKGPASAYSGRGSAGGSINLVSKSPRLNTFSQGSIELGTDERKRATIDINHRLDGLGLNSSAFRLNLMGTDLDIPGRDEVENKRWGVAPSLAFGLGTPTRLTLSYFHMEQNNVPDAGIPTIRDAAFINSPFSGEIAPVDFENYYGYTRRDHEDITSDVATLKLEHDFSDSLGIRNQLRYGRLDNESITSSPRIRNNTGGQITPDTLVRGNGKFRDQVEEILINQTDLSANFATGALRHALVTGVELSREEAENRRRLDIDGPDTNLFNPNPDLLLNAAQLGIFNGTRAKLEVETIAAYAVDTIKLSERWAVAGGVRWDNIHTRVQGLDDAGATPGYVTDESRRDTELSWRTSLSFRPRPNGTIYAGVGSSFEPVASALNTSAGVVQLGGGNNNPPVEAGFDVDPEETRAYEIGTKWEVLNQRLLLSAAIFRTEKTDARNVDPVTGDVVLTGEQRVDGFEIGAAGSITSAWQVFAGYTYLDSEILDSDLATIPEGAEIDNTPEHTFSLWTTYQTPWKALLGFGAQFVDERTNQPNSATAVPVTVDDFWLLDAMIAYPVTKNIGVRLNFLNLTDEEYIEQLGGGQAVPGASRSAWLTLDFSFF